ncbi:MFS transporter [Actinomycetospora sp. NBRC 106375]|uniref:OFA family MFS transporter n=1 Tax=Actinomycetospora sp. NBRC 106375 TaxID=3032207 RepID=UPI0024A2750E|nr:OFA family MFS transporter [Actinomycetospora sp. NBRC 106375]GLZ47484.1 MFS transporter [Actinomycetospora sp. NBRC 106375]
MTVTDPPYREITDARGRVYRVGESPQQILGVSRKWMVWLPWLAMMGISVFEYGYGAAESTLEDVHGWSLSQAFWLVAVWTVFQAGVAFPAGRLREQGKFSARTAMFVGAGCVFLAFAVLGVTSSLLLNFLFYSVIGGIGSGLVYATCINMVGKWYPEKRGGKTGFVNGGFAYGAVPFIFVFSYLFDKDTFTLVLVLVGVYMLVVVALCAILFKDPPKNWWPEEVDPLTYHTNPKSARSLEKNPPAVRQYTPMEAIKTGQLPLMWLSFAIIGGVSLFGIGYQVDFAEEVGFGPFIAASSAGVLSIVNGVGRGVVGWVSDLIGRRQTLVLVLAIEGVAQFGLLWSGNAGNEVGFMFFAFVAGFGGGAFFPLFAALTPDYFGENYNATNYGLVYSAKLVGGLFGLGAASHVVEVWGYDGAYTIAGVIAFVSAGTAAILRQPGRTRDGKVPASGLFDDTPGIETAEDGTAAAAPPGPTAPAGETTGRRES